MSRIRIGAGKKKVPVKQRLVGMWGVHSCKESPTRSHKAQLAAVTGMVLVWLRDALVFGSTVKKIQVLSDARNMFKTLPHSHLDAWTIP